MNAIKRIAAMAVLLLAGALACSAQRYQPKDTWPYLYPDFQNALVFTASGVQVQEAMMNVTVDGKLHFIRDEKILAVDMKNVYTARLGNDVYVNAGGKLMKVLAENDNGAVVLESSIDVDKMSKADIGYGVKSATASTQNITTLAGGTMDAMVDMALSTVMDQKASGSVIAMKESTYLRVGMNLTPASKRGLMDNPYVDKATAKAFLKSIKIDWKNPKSLLKVVDFIATEKNK